VFRHKGPDRLVAAQLADAVGEIEDAATSPPKLSMSSAMPRTPGSAKAA